MADVNKEIALKVTTNVDQTTGALQTAEFRLNEAKKAMIDLALAGKQGSAEFRELALEAGTLKGKLELVEQTIDGIGKSTNKIEVFSGAMQGLSAGFAIAQGTAALFAEGNEELQESLVRVQASLALLQGTEQALQLLRKENAAGQRILIGLQKAYAIAVNIATAATRSFSAALTATGIGALVVALGLLVSKFMESSAAIKQSNLDLEEAAKKQKQLSDEIALTNKLRQSEIDLAAAAGASAKQTALENIKLLKDNIAEKQKEIDAEQKLIDQIEVNKSKVIDAQKEILDVLINQTEQKKNLLQVEFNDLNSKLQQQLGVVKEYDENASKSRTDNSLKARQQIISDLQVEMNYRKEVGESTLELEEKLLKEKLSYAELTKTGVMQAQTELRLFLMQGSIDAEKLAKDDADQKVEAEKDAQQKLKEIQNEIRRSKLTDYQREREDFLLQRAQMLELMRASGAEAIELQLFAQNTEQLAKQMDADRKIEIDKETAKREKEIQEQATQARFDIVLGGLQAIGDLAASFAGKSEEQQKKAFNVQKAANIAMATIETYLSAASAYKSQLLIPTPDAPIRAAIAAGVAIASGLARVAAISKTQFKSTAAPTNTGGGGSIPNPSGGQPQVPGAFNPNVTPTNPTGQPNPQGGQNGTTRVIVVESDIRRVTTRVDAAERFATFG